MTAKEIFDILKITGINACAETFTYEDIAGDAFYSFDKYIEEHGYDFEYDMCSGASKAVIVPKNEDFVIKIPFAGLNDYYNQPYDYNEVINEYVYDDDYDPFVPLQYDYCKLEEENYRYARENDVDNYFAKINLIGFIDGFAIYVQDKVESFFHSKSRGHHSEKEKEALTQSYRYEDLEQLPLDWALDFINAYGEEEFINFLIFTIEYHINDLRNENVAYRNGKPIVCDYSGYWS